MNHHLEHQEFESAEEIKSELNRTKHEVEDKTREISDKLKNLGMKFLRRQADSVADRLFSAKNTVTETADNLRTNGSSIAAAPLDIVSDAVEKLGRFIDSESHESVRTELSDFIRRHPLTTMGSSFLAGLLIARTLRASGESG